MQAGELPSGLAFVFLDLNWATCRNFQMAAVAFGELATYNPECIEKGGKGVIHTSKVLKYCL
jgi:hypothetical protein